VKACNTCFEIKDFDSFYRNPKCWDGYRGRCKPCGRPRDLKASRKYRARNLEKLRVEAKVYRIKNKAKITECEKGRYSQERNRTNALKTRYGIYWEAVELKNLFQKEIKNAEEKFG